MGRCNRRDSWRWLLLVMFVEVNCFQLLLSWFRARDMAVEITNLVASTPGGDWWALAINQTAFVLLVGFLLVWTRRYGIIVGLTIALLLVCLYWFTIGA